LNNKESCIDKIFIVSHFQKKKKTKKKKICHESCSFIKTLFIFIFQKYFLKKLIFFSSNYFLLLSHYFDVLVLKIIFLKKYYFNIFLIKNILKNKI